jgi:hypothetical protein
MTGFEALAGFFGTTAAVSPFSGVGNGLVFDVLGYLLIAFLWFLLRLQAADEHTYDL